MNYQLTLTETPIGLAVSYDGSAPIPLKPGYESSTLNNLFIHLRGGSSSSSILRSHVSEHQGQASSSCPFCKVEGKILSAQGRTYISQTKYAAYAPQPGKADLLAIAKIIPEGTTAASISAKQTRFEAALSAEAKGETTPSVLLRKASLPVEIDF